MLNLERAKDLRRRGMDREAETLLQALIDREEGEAAGKGVEHWYYEHLAALYHERGDDGAEIEILERYGRQQPASEAMAAMMAQRLETAQRKADSR